MPEILMHMFQITALPFWDETPYRRPFEWLKDNNLIFNHAEEVNAHFIRGWGNLRYPKKPRIFAHRIWRYVANMGSHANFAREAIHLIPLRIVPTWKLTIEQPYLKALRFYIDITPQTISTHVVVSIDYTEAMQPLSQFENHYCTLYKKGNNSIRLKLSELVKFVNQEIFKNIINDCSINILEQLDVVWHTSFGVMLDDINPTAALDFFKNKKYTDTY